MRAAAAAGQTEFGENYVQEAEEKIRAVPGAEWHLIGKLQRNKTRDLYLSRQLDEHPAA